jgi:hypothetical protein
MSVANLLPRNSTAWERAVADALSAPQAIEDAITLVGRVKFFSPPPSFLPFLIWEYGLSELALYQPNPYLLIDDGRRWQTLRGSTDAIELGLSWLGYTASFDGAPPERTWWNTFQLYLGELPAADHPDLERIEGIAQLSVPRRSRYRRGAYLYDAPAAELDWTRLDEAMLDFESGVPATDGTRFWAEPAIWSFGRPHEVDHLLTEEEGTAIGNWLEPVEDSLPWTALDYPWVRADFPWAAAPDVIRRTLMATWFDGRVPWLELRDGDGGVIGWRRCRAVHAVKSAADGLYAFGGAFYDPSSTGGRVYIEAMTDFEDADLVTAAEAAIVVGAALADGVPAGRRWAAPGELEGGNRIAVTEIAVPLRRTVRERFKFMLRF